jgi:hypothetical protein
MRDHGAAVIRLANANGPTPIGLRTVRQTATRRFGVSAAAVGMEGPVPGTEPLPPEVLAF